MADAGQMPLTLRLSAGLHGTAAVVAVVQPALWPYALGAVAGNHALLTAAGLWPRSQIFGPTVFRVAEGVALTFDDGPDPAVTPRVLDLLDEAGVRASFFCIGERARQHPALVRRLVDAGHAVENHSLTHPHLFSCHGTRALRREVETAQAVLADITGQAPRWFRAPMGFRSPLLTPVLQRLGLGQAAWTRRGYDTRCRDPALVLRRLVRGLGGGDVLLLHDGHSARTADGSAVVLDVLPGLLRVLRERQLAGVGLPRAG